MIQATKNIGRNDKCPCGSGKKHKNCCRPKVVASKKKVLNQQGLLRVLYLLTKDAGGIKSFTSQEIGSPTIGELRIGYDPDKDAFTFVATESPRVAQLGLPTPFNQGEKNGKK